MIDLRTQPTGPPPSNDGRRWFWLAENLTIIDLNEVALFRIDHDGNAYVYRKGAGHSNGITKKDFPVLLAELMKESG